MTNLTNHKVITALLVVDPRISAQTFRIDVRDQYESTTSYAAAKLGALSDLEREYERYEKYLSPVLPVGGFAHVIKFTKAGAANTGGLFYALAKEYDQTLFDALRSKPESGARIVEQLRRLESHWQSGA